MKLFICLAEPIHGGFKPHTVQSGAKGAKKWRGKHVYDSLRRFPALFSQFMFVKFVASLLDASSPLAPTQPPTPLGLSIQRGHENDARDPYWPLVVVISQAALVSEARRAAPTSSTICEAFLPSVILFSHAVVVSSR